MVLIMRGQDFTKISLEDTYILDCIEFKVVLCGKFVVKLKCHPIFG